MNLAQWIRQQFAWLGYDVSTEGYDVATIQAWAQSLWGWMQRATVDALIMVESSGDPYASRPGSQFKGILQMSNAAAEDVGISDPSVLLGAPNRAIDAFWDYQRRYAGRTDGVPLWMAVLWHDGPGNLRKIRAEFERTGDLDAALAVGTDAIPEYVRRYQRWMRKVAEGYDVRAKIQTFMA